MIEGTALDTNENPVAGATVYLIPGNYRIPNAIQKAVADGSGDYRFYVEDPGDEYTIIAYKPNGDEIRGVTARTLKGEAT
jgi:hypothetical protein